MENEVTENNTVYDTTMKTSTGSQSNTEWLESTVWTLALLYEILLFYCLHSYICRNCQRISYTEDLPENYVGMMLYGVVTGISDGDGFRFFHCPWLRFRFYTFKDSKLYVRLAGIDAPEMENQETGMPGQPFAKKSMDYLSTLIRRKYIKIKIVGVDRYHRVLTVAYLPDRWYLKLLFSGWFPLNFFEWVLINYGWFQKDSLYINVNLEMVKEGYACVYEGPNAIYDGYEESFRRLEEKAKREKKGMWKSRNPVTPMMHKRNHRQ